ncbi:MULTISPECIES: hypothetical protein [unclassified Yoonia]|uniref:hypothetical protein n=1 Tax=unclassified Yoonia TaxID=2629118 RepID=UPI002AFE89F9|nr:MULTISPECIES: hypothetical protein [unclassified Yoonia]
MTELSYGELEGRLNAQREVLAILLGWAMRQPDTDIAAHLAEGLSVQDHQEDPGAQPDPAFAIEAAGARELQMLLERAKALRNAK